MLKELLVICEFKWGNEIFSEEWKLKECVARRHTFKYGLIIFVWAENARRRNVGTRNKKTEI